MVGIACFDGSVFKEYGDQLQILFQHLAQVLENPMQK